MTLVVPGEGGGTRKPRAFVERVPPALDTFKQYAGAAFAYSYDKTTKTIDYSKGFASCIKSSAREEVWRRK